MGPKGKKAEEEGSARRKRGKTKAAPSKAQADDVRDGPQPGAAAPTAPSQSAAVPPASNVQEHVQAQARNTAPARKRKATEEAGPPKAKKPKHKSPAPGPRPIDDTIAVPTAHRTARPGPAAAQPASKAQATTQPQTQSGALAPSAPVRKYGVEGQSLEHQIDLEFSARVHAYNSPSHYREQGTLAYPEHVYTNSRGVAAALVEGEVQERAIPRFEKWKEEEDKRKKEVERNRKEKEEDKRKEKEQAQQTANNDASDNQVTGPTTRSAAKSKRRAKRKGGANENEATKEAKGSKDKTAGGDQAGTKENAGGQNEDRSAGTESPEKVPDGGQNILQKVWIVIDAQQFYTLYGKDFGDGDPAMDYRPITEYVMEGTTRLPEGDEGLDRETLMSCSREAYDFFTRVPTATELHLPIKYPDSHNGLETLGEQVAYIDPEVIKYYIIPWLRDVEEWRRGHKKERKEKNEKGSHRKKKEAGNPGQSSPQTPDQPPSIQTPNDIEGKIHLYNAMLQLAIPRKLQHTLIEELCKEIYSSKLPPSGKGDQRPSHLDLLEITIGRLNSRTVAVLDPVLQCLAGSFGLRGQRELDLILPHHSPTTRQNMQNDDSNEVLQEMSDRPGLLNYGIIRVKRNNQTNQQPLPNDTIIRPPKLPAIGHSLRNWSGVRRNGDYRPAHTDYPLYIGESVYYNREDRVLNAGRGSGEADDGASNDDGNPDLNQRRFVGGLGECGRRDYLRATIKLMKNPEHHHQTKGSI